MNTVAVSASFKQKAIKAIFSILLFVITYILLVILAIGLTIACGYGGVMIILARPSFLTLMLGIGVMSIGVLILFFLVKFIFTKNKTDLSNYIEVKKEDEPQLFAFISEIVREVNTSFPKKVYLSSEVNASVFYNSGFWSMFLPVRKNLHIGLGLMNTITVDEFKGILAHEFGHFSQKSMKVGSYVYNVNYIIHNMLYDNNSYSKIVSGLANTNAYIGLVVMLGVKIIAAIQWILRQVYQVINLSYLALSKEMEFHADEVAANVAGSQPLISSMARAELAANAFGEVLNFYSRKVKDNISSGNLFPLQAFVMNFTASEFAVPIVNGLPQVSLATKNRFDRSRLALDNQWSSHPEDSERIQKLESLNLPLKNSNPDPAASLLVDRLKTEEKITGKLFENVMYAGPVTRQPAPDFEKEYIAEHSGKSFHKKYNNYYDDMPLALIDFQLLSNEENSIEDISEKQLFSQAKVDLIYDSIGLENDLKVVNSIASGEIKMKSFDYDGQRFKASEAATLVPTLTDKFNVMREAISSHDMQIFKYYRSFAIKEGKLAEYRESYNLYYTYRKKYDTFFERVGTMYKAIAFIHEQTPFDAIKRKMELVSRQEYDLKKDMKELLENDGYNPYISTEAREEMTKYISQAWVYFSYEVYNEAALQVLYGALHYYNLTINEILFRLKKQFLDLQAAI